MYDTDRTTSICETYYVYREKGNEMALKGEKNRALHDKLMAEVADLKAQLDASHVSRQEFLDSVQSIVEDIGSGKDARLNPDHCSDDFKELAYAVNSALHAVSDQEKEKSPFYQSVLESFPFPISVADLNKNKIYANKKAEALANATDILGMHSISEDPKICDTNQWSVVPPQCDECESLFEQDEGYYKSFSSKLQNPRGDVIGHIETVMDLTDLKKDMRYQEEAMSTLRTNLHKISCGDFDLHFVLPLPDNNTEDTHRYFTDVYQILEKIIKMIQDVTYEAKTLTEALHEGHFDYHGDLSHYEGNFKLLVGHMNDIQDIVSKPVQDATRICACFVSGDFTDRSDESGKTHTNKGEWGELEALLHKIGISIRKQIQTISDQLSALSLLTETANKDIKVGMQGTEQVLQLTEDVRQNISNSSESIFKIVKVMKDLNISVEEAVVRSHKVSENASLTNEYAEIGMEQTKKSGQVMEGITESTEVLETLTKDINMQMTEIGKIVKLISDISNQTNFIADCF